MSDHETESFTPYEPQASYDWDYGDEPPKRNNVLWGRLVALGVVLVLTFLLGRASAPEGVPEKQLNDVRAQLDEAEDELAQLRAALETPAPAETETPAEGVVPEETPTDAPFEGDIYVVQSGDTMRGIAERFCDDPALDDFIAEFNQISDPTLIRPGQEIKIPEDCGA